ncbi:hypothetical protein HNQ02_002240 [Flavobacterium sp. 7E]|uniref:DUF4199 domain-containing protein n=1 Tax=unclassified Flavobacterium TaxID=196869 RepID=UPI00156D9C0F|nr:MULTISPECIES: DUF4199 domain-containing protein [unclassified Flavobacterium]MBE0393106.1 hypothetical protein [Flavobacterium sp. PL002]NRS89314.1 hypothetical protein [Flavobacterium sp. 7E]
MVNEIVKKNGVNFGVITGVVSILMTTIIYIVDLKLFTSPWIGFATMAIYIILGIILLNKTKKDLKGIFPFKDAFTTYFISAVIGILLSVLFSIILFNYIDPAAKDTIRELSAKYLAKTLSSFGTPASSINEAITKLKETDQFSPLEQLKGSIFSILFSAILGLILAAIFKSKSTQE